MNSLSKQSDTSRMFATNSLNSAIEKFTNWQQPWTFFEAIKHTCGWNEEALTTWQRVWGLACQAEYWQTADLNQCTKFATEALQQAFPWLSMLAIEQIIKAAHYEWR